MLGSIVSPLDGLRSPFGPQRGFNPARLFGLSDTGWFYDPNDMETMFQDAAGTTPADFGLPVGLMLDKSKGLVLGPELVANGTFDTDTAWSKGAGVTIAGGVATYSGVVTNADLVTQNISVVSGRTYAVTYTVSSLTGGLSARIGGVNGVFYTTAGTRTEYIVAGATGSVAVGILGRGAGVSAATIDNISVRELPGNHRFQTVSNNRPILGRHPFSGIRNLLVRTEEFADAVWQKLGTASVIENTAVAPDGTTTVDRAVIALGSNQGLRQDVPLAAGTYRFSVWARAIGSATTLRLASFGLDGSKVSNMTLPTGSLVRYEATFTYAVGGTAQLRIDTNDLGGTIEIWGAQLELGSTATPYQRVGSAFDVTEAGVPSINYLAYGNPLGSLTSSLSTSAFAWGSDKATVVAGVRKLSNAIGVICETSTNFTSNGGSFSVLSGNNAGGVYSSGVNGTLIAGAALVTQGAAPDTAVITHIGDISGDLVRLRRNSVIGIDSLNDRGAGNFGTYPVFFGARGGTSGYFVGREYPNLGINRLLTANELAQIERFTAQRTGVTIVSPFKAYALGDSTVAAFAGGTALMQLFDTGYTEIDLSVPGHTIAQQKTAWVNQTIVADETAWVIMQIGLNDLVPAEAASVAIARLQDLADTIKAEIGSKPLLIAQMIPCRQRLINIYGATDGPIAYQKWLDMNAAIAGLGPTPITGVQGRITEHVPLMDDGNGNLRAEFDTGDGIHPNNAGRQVNVTAWRNALGVLGL